MNLKISERQKSPSCSNGTKCYLVGPMRLQNELIAKCLEKENGNLCILVENINEIPTDNLKPGAQKCLILRDCLGENMKGLLSELKFYQSKNESEHRVVFFNVPNDMVIEKKYVLNGIHGLFYKHDALDIFLKGVRAVMNGKLWFSREMMTQCIFEGTVNDKSSKKIYEELTERQIEILAMISVGATNDEIADKLCISPHTVKTHLYRIFKKINVPNRVQAALWAAANL